MWWRIQIKEPPLWKFSPVSRSPSLFLGPNTFLRTVLSKTLDTCSCLIGRDQVSRSHKNTENVFVTEQILVALFLVKGLTHDRVWQLRFVIIQPFLQMKIDYELKIQVYSAIVYVQCWYKRGWIFKLYIYIYIYIYIYMYIHTLRSKTFTEMWVQKYRLACSIFQQKYQKERQINGYTQYYVSSLR